MHTKFIHLKYPKCPYPEKITKKGSFIRPFELNERLLSAEDQSRNLLGTTSQMWATFGLCLKCIALLFVDLSCSKNLDIL